MQPGCGMVKHYLQRIKRFGIYSNTANDLWPLCMQN